MKNTSRGTWARSISCAAPAAVRMYMAIVDEFRLLAADLYWLGGLRLTTDDKRQFRGMYALPHRDLRLVWAELEVILLGCVTSGRRFAPGKPYGILDFKLYLRNWEFSDRCRRKTW